MPGLLGIARAAVEPLGARGALTGGERAFDIAAGTVGGVAGAATAEEDATWQERAARGALGASLGGLAGANVRQLGRVGQRALPGGAPLDADVLGVASLGGEARRAPRAGGATRQLDLTEAPEAELTEELRRLLATPRPTEPAAASRWDALLAFMTSNLLSNPRSLLGNALGGLEQGLGRAATRIGERGPIGGAQDIWTEMKASWAAKGDILRGAGRQFVTGERPPAVGETLGEATDQVAPAFAGKRGMLATPALRVAGATDALFAMTARAGAEAVADARGLTGTAREAFVGQQVKQSVLSAPPSSLAKTISEGRQLLSSPDWGDRAKGAALFAYIPVVRIPQTIWSQGVRRAVSPVLDLPGAAKDLGNLARGRPERVGPALRNWTTNSTVAGLAAWQVGEGNFTGSGPQDPEERRRWEAQGWRPNSFRVGGEWYSYDWLGPLALQLNLVATFAETLRAEGRTPTKTELERYTAAFNRTAAVAVDEHYLRNFFRIIESIGDGRASDALAQGALELGGRLVPVSGALNWAAGGLDPLEREAKTPLERQQARTPLRGLLEPVVDPTTGEPLERGGTPLQRLGGFGRVLPQASEVRRETARLALLRDAEGQPLYPGVTPRAFDEREVTYAGKRQTEASKRVLQRAFGSETNRYLAKLIADPRYGQATDAQKAAMVQDALSEAALRADVRAGTQIARDPRSQANYEYLAVPQYEGISPTAGAAAIRQYNLDVRDAKQQLDRWRKRYPDAPGKGEAEFARAYPDLVRLARKPGRAAADLRVRRREIEQRVGAAPDADAEGVFLLRPEGVP